MADGTINDCDNFKYEMKSAEELHRFESSLMLGQTAVYLIASGTLLRAISAKATVSLIQFGVATFGIFLSLVFTLIAHRTGANMRGARDRAEELSALLGFKLYSSKYRARKNRFLVGKYATIAICIFGAILWTVIFMKFIFDALLWIAIHKQCLLGL